MNLRFSDPGVGEPTHLATAANRSGAPGELALFGDSPAPDRRVTSWPPRPCLLGFLLLVGGFSPGAAGAATNQIEKGNFGIRYGARGGTGPADPTAPLRAQSVALGPGMGAGMALPSGG